MMGHSASQEGLHLSNFIQKDFLLKRIKSLQIDLHHWAIQQDLIAEVTETQSITTLGWAQTLAENGWQTSDSIQFPAWRRSLETVESVNVAGVERVYDIEVEDNHNFVANGLSIHNCHMLSPAAFSALLKTLEEPPKRVVFVLATTDPQRVLPTIISRCQRFDFRRIALEAMVTHLRKIATKENINITQETVQLVAQVSQGGLRDAESLLDQLSLLSGQVTVERVWDLVGSCSEPDLMELLQAIAQNNHVAVLDCARRVMDRGREPLTVLQNLAGFYRDLLIVKTAPNRSDLVAVTPPTWKALCDLAVLWNISSILAGQQHLAKSEVQIKNTTQPRLWLEVALLGLLPAANSDQLMVSVPEKGIHRQSVDAFSRNTPKQQQRITSDGISQTPQTPPPEAASAAEKFLPPVELGNSQPIINQGAPTSTPIPEPAAVERNSLASAPLSVANSAGENPQQQIWQQVLAHLQPKSTQALLGQMGHLIEFNGTVARIGIKSQAWCNQAKNYLPNIKAAFQEAFKCEVQVSLELATPTQTKTTPVNELRSPITGTAPATSPQTAEPLAASHFATTSSRQTQVFNQFQPGMAAESASAPKVSESPTMGVTASAPTAAADWNEDEVAIASQRLADFFKGEVVKFNSESTFADSTNTNSPPLIATSVAQTWDDAEIAVGEAELDF